MAQKFQDVACTACGCVCDDLTVLVDSGRIVAVQRACALGEPWFLGQGSDCDSPVQVDGAPAEFTDGVGRAAEILVRSRSPLVFGLSSSSTPGQRAAVQLAEVLGATLDTARSPLATASTLALQSVGISTATLGEVRNRADLVIYWGSNPQSSHPRHVERFVDAPGMFVTGGRRDRQLVVVDVQRTATAELADQFLQVESGGDFELLRTLRAALKGVDLGNGVPPEVVALAERLKSCRYGAVFYGSGLARHGVPHANVTALLELVTELNAHARFVALPMRSTGATQALTWLTGYPLAVSFAHGYPCYGPDEFTAELLLERGEVDAVVLVGTEGITQLSPAAQKALAQLPIIMLRSPTESCSLTAAVSFATAVYGIHRPGTAYRMDGVPIPLRKLLESTLPSDAEVLAAIHQECSNALASPTT